MIFSAMPSIKKQGRKKMYTYGFYNVERIRMEREIDTINKHWRTAKCQCHDNLKMAMRLF